MGQGLWTTSAPSTVCQVGKTTEGKERGEEKEKEEKQDKEDKGGKTEKEEKENQREKNSMFCYKFYNGLFVL